MMRILICAFAAACLAPQIAAAQAGPQAGALGLTRQQLEDADLIDSSGREIGEVEGVVTDPSGAVTNLIIELDQRDPAPDRRVMIPLDDLKAARQRGGSGGYDIQTRQSADELMKLPPASTTSRRR